MKARILTLIATTAFAAVGLAQYTPTPQMSGLVPVTSTIYVNTNYSYNSNADNVVPAIAANGNVLIGWGDGPPSGSPNLASITNYGSVWTLFDANGNRLTPATQQTNQTISGAGNPLIPTYQTIVNDWLSFFRADGSAAPSYGIGSTKVKANLFGDGIGMGANGTLIGLEVPSLLAINQDNTPTTGMGEFPAVQLLNNNGIPAGIVEGATDANNQPAGRCRIGDWDYLSNGNIVITAEDQQVADRYPAQTGGSVGKFRIVTPAGVEVVPWTKIQTAAEGSMELFHGIGVTANGFALRFKDTTLLNFPSGPIGITMRCFLNDGTPTTGDIDMGALQTALPSWGLYYSRGEQNGFHGNGKDAYVHASPGPLGQSDGIVLQTFNADGSFRTNIVVALPGEVNGGGDRLDAAIAADGTTIAVFAAPASADVGTINIQARLFSPDGTPLGDRFAVSELENTNAPAFLYSADRPRVAWRGNKVVISWRSKNMVAAPTTYVAATRFFEFLPLKITNPGGVPTITWSAGTLQCAGAVSGTYTNVTPTPTSPYAPALGSAAFYRLVQP